MQREREREREIYGRGETKVSDSEGVRREKVKGREKKGGIVFQKKKNWKTTYRK